MEAVAGLPLVGVTGPFVDATAQSGAYAAHLKAPFALTIALSRDGADAPQIDIDRRMYSPVMANAFIRVAAGMARTFVAARGDGKPLALDAIEWLDPRHAAEVIALGLAAPLPSNAEPGRIEERIARHPAQRPRDVAVSFEGLLIDEVNDGTGGVSANPIFSDDGLSRGAPRSAHPSRNR